MNILNKGKPRHKHMNPRRQWRKLLTALTVSISMAVAPAAMADMNGYDISNWQCGIDTATVPADFVIVGTTWGSGGVYGGCLSNGVNTDANRQLARFLTASHFVGKAVVVIKRHLLDGGNAALVKHAHVVRIPRAHLGQREEIAHHAPDLLGIARLRCKTVSRTGGSIENAGLRARCKADDRDITKKLVKHSCRICVLGIRCQRFG